jgi:hypothetical protein
MASYLYVCLWEVNTLIPYSRRHRTGLFRRNTIYRHELVRQKITSIPPYASIRLSFSLGRLIYLCIACTYSLGSFSRIHLFAVRRPGACRYVSPRLSSLRCFWFLVYGLYRNYEILEMEEENVQSCTGMMVPGNWTSR